MKERHQLTIEERRDIFLAAVQIEEASILASRKSGHGEQRPYSDSRLNWKDWQIEFYGCIPDGTRAVLVAHYSSPVAETRNPKGRQLTNVIRELWRKVRQKRLIGMGLNISETLKI